MPSQDYEHQHYEHHTRTPNLQLKCSSCHTNEIALLSDCICYSLFIGNTCTCTDDDDIHMSLDNQYAFVFSSSNTKNIITTTSSIATATDSTATDSTTSSTAFSTTFSNAACNYKRKRSSLGFSYAVSEVWCACCQANLGRAVEMEGKSTSTILLQKSKVEH